MDSGVRLRNDKSKMDTGVTYPAMHWRDKFRNDGGRDLSLPLEMTSPVNYREL